jgi:hypothetical protein
MSLPNSRLFDIPFALTISSLPLSQHHDQDLERSNSLPTCRDHRDFAIMNSSRISINCDDLKREVKLSI